MNAPAIFPKSRLSAGEKTCWLLTVVGAAMVAVPVGFGQQLESWNGGQFALGFAGLLVALTAFICTFLFRRRRKIGDGLLDERKLLAHWTYDVAEWRQFTEEDFGRERHEKWTLYGVLVGICGLVGGAFWRADPRGGGPVVAGILAGLCAFIAVIIAVTTRWQRRGRLEHRSEVRIGADGLWMGGELHVWQGWGARLESCELGEGHPPFIAFGYSMPARNGRQFATVRVPIPSGREDEAAGLVERFRARLGRA